MSAQGFHHPGLPSNHNKNSIFLLSIICSAFLVVVSSCEVQSDKRKKERKNAYTHTASKKNCRTVKTLPQKSIFETFTDVDSPSIQLSTNTFDFWGFAPFICLV